MHCLRDCDPFELNTSTTLSCNRTIGRMTDWHLANAQFDREFAKWDGKAGRFLSVDYEALAAATKLLASERHSSPACMEAPDERLGSSAALYAQKQPPTYGA